MIALHPAMRIIDAYQVAEACGCRLAWDGRRVVMEKRVCEKPAQNFLMNMNFSNIIGGCARSRNRLSQDRAQQDRKSWS